MIYDAHYRRVHFPNGFARFRFTDLTKSAENGLPFRRTAALQRGGNAAGVPKREMKRLLSLHRHDDTMVYARARASTVGRRGSSRSSKTMLGAYAGEWPKAASTGGGAAGPAIDRVKSTTSRYSSTGRPPAVPLLPYSRSPARTLFHRIPPYC